MEKLSPASRQVVAHWKKAKASLPRPEMLAMDAFLASLSPMLATLPEGMSPQIAVALAKEANPKGYRATIKHAKSMPPPRSA